MVAAVGMCALFQFQLFSFCGQVFGHDEACACCTWTFYMAI